MTANTAKTSYRKVYKSDHLGIIDLEEYSENGSNLVFTISHTRQEYGAKVAGRKVDCNVAYFKEKIKPMVINATNGKQISKFANSIFVEDWNNIPVQLYIDKGVKMKGEVVGGIRIKGAQPRISKPALTDISELIEAAIQNGWNGVEALGKAKAMYTVSKEIEQKILTEVGKK